MPQSNIHAHVPELNADGSDNGRDEVEICVTALVCNMAELANQAGTAEDALDALQYAEAAAKLADAFDAICRASTEQTVGY